jgi:ABC-type branched-subunit amino acid transport system substrate-binding protein/serine/threonine protein kinase
MIGELVGARYRVINVLASGGFGHTYIAEDIQRPGNPRCVLKHLTFNSQDPAILQQVRRLFQAEAETLEQLGRHDQIPRLLAYFEEAQQFYLVQEFIEGHPLNEELIKGVRLSEVEVIPILEDVLGVLEYVHAQGVIHRDIKPANLIRRRQDSKLVLIDFGAVKLIGNTIAEATGETALSMPVYTSGYAASEQCMGRPRFASDLYSLGMVGIQALTGLHPSQLPHDYGSSELVWRNQATVSDELADVLTTMTRYHFNDRYQSASDALQALRGVIATAPTLLTNKTALHNSNAEVTRLSPSVVGVASNRNLTRFHFPGSRTATRIGLALAGTLAVAILVRSLSDFGFWVPVSLPGITDQLISLRDDPRISAGEKPLIKWNIDPKKQEGIDYFATGDYANAVIALEAARQKQPDDPETLIYLNNARIGDNSSHTIAVVSPIDSVSLPSALELLRGAAQAQDEINRAGGLNGVPLKLLIVDDNNREELAAQLAQKLAEKSDVLGVIGHGSSDTSYTAGRVYQNQGLVMITPVSSAMELASIGNFIFRTMPSDQQTANALKDYLLNRLQKRRVAVFYNSNSTYSQSLKQEFDRALLYSGAEGAKVVEEVDLSRPDFDPEESIKLAIAQGAQALMLAPNGDVMDKAFRVVEVNNRKLPILAGDSMFNTRLPRFGKSAATAVVLAVPVDITAAPFQQIANDLWGKPELVSWRTALTYDSTKAFAQAIANNSTRHGIRRQLAQPDFEVQGATGTVNFLPEGDRNNQPAFVTVAAVGSGANQRYTFVPLSPQK